MVPLVIAATGKPLGADGDPVAVQRTFGAARSIEFDAIVLAASPVPAADAHGARDAKAAADQTGGNLAGGAVDSRVLLMLTEAYRHGKALGAWGSGTGALEAVGIPVGAPGVVSGEEAGAVLDRVSELLAEHRVWERFPTAV